MAIREKFITPETFRCDIPDFQVWGDCSYLQVIEFVCRGINGWSMELRIRRTGRRQQPCSLCRW